MEQLFGNFESLYLKVAIKCNHESGQIYYWKVLKKKTDLLTTHLSKLVTNCCWNSDTNQLCLWKNSQDCSKTWEKCNFLRKFFVKISIFQPNKTKKKVNKILDYFVTDVFVNEYILSNTQNIYDMSWKWFSNYVNF